MIYFFVYYVYHSTVTHNFNKMSGIIEVKEPYDLSGIIEIEVPEDWSLKDYIKTYLPKLEKDRKDRNDLNTIYITKKLYVYWYTRNNEHTSDNEHTRNNEHIWTFTYSNNAFDDYEKYELSIERPPPGFTTWSEDNRCRINYGAYSYKNIIALSSQVPIGTYIEVSLYYLTIRFDIPISILEYFQFCDSGEESSNYCDYIEHEVYSVFFNGYEFDEYKISVDDSKMSYWLFSGGCKSDQYIHVNEMKNHDSIGENKILTTFYLAIQRLCANGTIVPITILEFLVLFNENVSFSILHHRNPYIM